MSDPDDEVDELRAMLERRGLLPPVDHLLHSQEDFDRLARTITSTTHPSARRGRYPRMLLVAASAAVILVVVGMLVRVLGSSSPAVAADAPPMLHYSLQDLTRLSEAPAATTVLRSAAETAAAASVDQGSGEVQYVSTFGWTRTDTTTTGSPVREIVPTATQWWLGPDGSVQVSEFLASALSPEGTVTTSPSTAQHDTDTFPAGSFDPTLARTLTRDPALVGQALVDGLAMGGCTPATPTCLTTALQSLYTNYVVPPDLSAALWTDLAGGPAFRWLGTTSDRLGTRVDAVGLQIDPQTVSILLISTTTGQLTGIETVTLATPDEGITRPTVTQFTLIEASQWVDRIGQLPGSQ